MTAISANRILLIEDDPEVVRCLSNMAQEELEMTLVSAQDGAQGLELALKEEFAIILVDINLPNLPGFSICREIRAKKPNQPLVFISGRREEIDRVLGLELGADDYIVKPFFPREVAARIRTIFRRSRGLARADETESLISLGGLKIDLDGRRVWIDEKRIQLTLIEFELLALLASNPGRTIDRSELLSTVLGYNSRLHDDTLTVHLSNLRIKIEKDPKNPVYLRTIRGVGYRFAAADELQGDC